MLILTLSGIFSLIIVIESSPLVTNNDPDNQCVLSSIECKPSLQHPCCHSNDYCKPTEFGGLFRCTEKIFTPGLGRFCERDEECDTIRHSKCLKNECVCRENNVEYNKTVCVPTLSGFCWENETCATENSICIDQECQCRDNYSQISNKCIINVLGAHCENDEICRQVKFATCSDKNICACSSNTVLVSETHCASPIDGSCWSDDDCLTLTSVCVDKKCKCRHGMVFYSDKCVKAFLEMPCLNDVECSSVIPYSKCSSSYSCTCEPYYFNYKGKCAPDSGTYCMTDNFCKMKNSACIESLCQCKQGFTYLSYVCVPISLDDSCLNSDDCHPIQNGICSIDKKCACIENYMKKNERSCIPMLGGICSADEDCTAANSICSDSKCQCKRNFVKRTENKCILVSLGMMCEYDSDCHSTKNSKCSDTKVCECIQHFITLDGIECLAVLGESTHSICLEDNCQSNDEFVSHDNEYKQPHKQIVCMEDNNCKQISNAKCIDNTCSCREHYAMISNTTCAPLLGQYCRPQQQCATRNSKCIHEKCQCDADYFDISDKLCVSKAGRVGIPCKNDYYCNNIKHAECSFEKKCTCKLNYVAFGDDQCIALIGESCDSDSECISYNTVCVDHKCQCSKKLVMRTKYQCDRISLGTTCQKNDDCRIALKNSVCSEDKVCICKENHFALNNFECVPYINERCTTDYDCRFNFSACIDNTCQCKLLYQAVSANQCVLLGSLFSCGKDLDCGDPWHNKCSKERKCICKRNNTYINKSTCSPLLGGYCWTDHQCVVKNSRCVDFQCTCRDSFRPISINMCMPVRQ